MSDDDRAWMLPPIDEGAEPRELTSRSCYKFDLDTTYEERSALFDWLQSGAKITIPSPDIRGILRKDMRRDE